MPKTTDFGGDIDIFIQLAPLSCPGVVTAADRHWKMKALFSRFILDL